MSVVDTRAGGVAARSDPATLVEAPGAPVVQTARLVLRGWRLSDYPAVERHYAHPTHTQFAGGPKTSVDCWTDFAGMAGQWSLRGYGLFAIEDPASGSAIGYAGIWHPADIPEPELAWSLFPGQEGNGFATEAARAARDWAWKAHGLGPLMSYLHPDNAASRRVAERLGARFEANGALRGRPSEIWRHGLPEAAHPSEMAKVLEPQAALTP